MAFKLGKRAPRRHPKTLSLAKYLPAGILPPPPEHRAWEYVISDDEWATSMLGNDSVGDCVIVMMLHYIMAATANTNKPASFSTQMALDLYSAITGYNPADPDTDQGTVITNALAYWQSTGCYGHKILAWASVGRDVQSLRQGIALFGGALVGTTITQSMEDQFGAGKPWNAPFDGDILGGHGIPLLGYGSEGQTCITWAKREQMDLQMPSNFDEAYVVITQDWLDAQGESPSQLHMSELQADIKLVSA